MLKEKDAFDTKLYPSPESLETGPVKAQWNDDASIDITFPGVPFEDAGLWGYVAVDDNGRKVMRAGSVNIPEQLEGHHLGKKLMRAFAFEAVNHGCEELKVDFRHPASLKASIEIFGYDRIYFEDTDKESLGLPLDEQGVTQHLVENWKAWEQRKKPHHRLADTQMRATIDLGNLNIDDWEPPLMSSDTPQTKK